ncbi:EAL domain-containing protein [Mesorhizobium sp. YR577]|uniref:EAL domain-containing protein n=1 Tax=Mesorhizobium sp. YR577 TaxID=1884373 RepID=UPI0008E8F453|nr:EAL domain-containing protein [Mesorhizobium sp. YR577]SFT85950.1 EAL domain, c-di-GMP-specific phosphodiesterase class I (or its enzymatically inactive variant) [Mesorhizobium sp. YR577]
MTSASGLLAAIDEAIFVDEVGIEIGVMGDLRLKSACQPIFSRSDDALVTVGVKSVPAFFLHGRPLTAEEFRDGAASPSAEFAEMLLRVLHLRNYRNIGLGDVDMFIDFDAGSSDLDTFLSFLPTAAWEPECAVLCPDMLVCELDNVMQFEAEHVLQLAEQMRWKGIRTGLRVYGVGQAGDDEIELIRPDVVRVDETWFGEICRDSATVRLFAPIVSALQDQGVKVLVEGIADAASLRVALDANVDLFQGDLLALAALAGTVFDEKPLPIARLLGRNVVRLFG